MREIFDTHVGSFAIDTKMILETILANTDSLTTKNEKKLNYYLIKRVSV